jgi:hypothetical protein
MGSSFKYELRLVERCLPVSFARGTLPRGAIEAIGTRPPTMILQNPLARVTAVQVAKRGRGKMIPSSPTKQTSSSYTTSE